MSPSIQTHLQCFQSVQAYKWLTCGEADVCRSPDQSEGCDPEGSQEGQGDDNLLVGEPAFAHDPVT